jgi:triosephosphate isomerase (TIM)
VKKSAPLIVGNWKAFIASPKEGLALLKSIDTGLPRSASADVVVCPPALLVAYLRSEYGGKRISLGVQDLSFVSTGAHTGDVTATLARASGATYAILGHAERRAEGVTDMVVAREARAALDAGLTPIICVGEKERDRDGHYFAAIEQSLTASVAGLMQSDATKLVIAYEPVWAIGAAAAPDARTVAEAVLFIRKTLASLYGREAALKIKILYGGAVDETTAEDLFQNGQGNGFLVGRASTGASHFLGIIRACSPKSATRRTSKA